MPEENLRPALLQAIEELEDHTLRNQMMRSQNYSLVHECLENEIEVDLDRGLVNRILKVCVYDMKEDLIHTTDAVNIISAILKNIKSNDITQLPELIPSALGIIHVINAIILLNNMETLRLLCVNTLLLFPDKVLVTIANDHCVVLIELFNRAGTIRGQLQLRLCIYGIIQKLLMILPSESKTEFVRAGINVWFSKVIPAIVSSTTCETLDDIPINPLDLFESLTDVLLTINYTDNPYWPQILGCICNPNKYPQIMKSLLENGSPLWHRMWIVFIRLLNNQITRNTNNIGTPINSMLPVVENAFKMDSADRCKAFQCWSVLIDIFSKETNENCIMKRLKLLIIPLRLNNAKVDETATAKFEAWWHLIIKFQTKLDKFIDSILIAFVHFCFGKHNSSGKTSFIPGQLSMNLKKRCVQSLVEIVGHVECEGCTEIPRLKNNLINTKYLIDYWNDWAHSLKIATKICLDNNNRQHIICLWKSFLYVMAQLPDSNVKKGVFLQLLKILASSLQDCRCEDTCDDLVFKAVMSSIFDQELKLTNLLKPNDSQEKDVLNTLISIILDPSLKSVYKRLTTQAMLAKLKPFTDFIIHESSKCSPKISIQLILCDLPSNDITLMLWSAIAETTCNYSYEICPKDLCYLLQWPLNSSNMFSDVHFAAKTWHKLYDMNFLKLNKTDIDKNISQLLLSSNIVMHSSIYFTLCATTAILKNGLHKNNSVEYQKEADLLKTLLNRIDDYKSIKDIFPMLIDTFVVMLNNVTITNNEKFTEATLMSIKAILKLIIPVLDQHTDISKIATLLKMLFNSIEALFKVEKYLNLHSIILDNLCFDCDHFKNHLLLKDIIQSLLKKRSINNKESNEVICDSIDLTSDDVVKNDADAKFTTPKIKDVPKKTKKKETSIVNTVVENGEEYVVVKSNWKFNPRKLTENQKEKLQRKREDIPALYQDLSQSQDEFKMSVWKTDSQDSSTTTKSSSRSANDGTGASNILKNLNNTEIVPKIMEHILGENDKKITEKHSDKPVDDKLIVLKPSTPKNTKTPRMALKDRVFRNVRNLIEKSTSSPVKEHNGSCNLIDNSNTPLSKPKDIANLVSSAPSLLLSDRPSRVKRKPKKFDDTEIFALKKRTLSQSDSQTNNEESEITSIKTDNELVDNFKVNCGDKENETTLIENNDKHQENLDDAKVIEDITALDDPKSSVPETINQLEMDICEENIPTADNRINKPPELSSANLDANNIEYSKDGKETIEHVKESNTTAFINEPEVVSTPKSIKAAEKNQTPSVRKSSAKKSRIEKELAIDMVEGHPFLNTPTTSEKRKTRKNIVGSINNIKRKKLADKLTKSTDLNTPSTSYKKEEETPGIKVINLDEVNSSDDKISSTESVLISEESCSEDIIESSQDSTLTTISVIKKTPKRLPIVNVEKMQMHPTIEHSNNATQNLLDENMIDEYSDENETAVDKSKEETIDINIYASDKICDNENNKHYCNLQNVKETPETCNEISSEVIQSTTNIGSSLVASDSSLLNQESRDDTELPQNKTLVEEKDEFDLTGNMDTAPIEQDKFDDVIIVNDHEQPIISISSDENIIGPQTQEIADADTQPNETVIEDIQYTQNPQQCVLKELDKAPEESHSNIIDVDKISDLDSTNTPLTINEKASDISSPFKDDIQRNQDFLNNTIEISPIKTVSPDLEKKSPSPDRSSDYVVIKLSSPVQSNGEPFEKGSPEFFTDEKISPDKRHQSPPRAEVTVINTSPSSSLSLKKNRPQVRSGGRAAQMLGLCVPDKLNPLMNSDRVDVDECRKNSPSNTPARRNLRILYNSVGDNAENMGENEENENFLKLKKSLPALNSSPSGPILKRKLAEITDETTVSPANKRKRVSFHDPPVSTTISVQKYIEPCGVRSPQNSAHKRQERQARMQTNLKSSKRLDNLFTLESVLTKTVESFTDVDISLTNSEDTQMNSLDQTPAAEIVKTSELNDTDSICPQLIDCEDCIDIIAAELSSPAMKSLLIKELEGKVATIGDLAKMTELEVNRLCIKAPKVKVAKKVLTEYAVKIERNKIIEKPVDKANEETVDVEMALPVKDKSSEIGVQTNDSVTSNVEIQTNEVQVSLVYTQTETQTSTVSAQTDESGNKTTAEIIQMCLGKPDFVPQLSEQLHDCSIQQIAYKLSFDSVTDTLMTKVDETNSNIVLDRLLRQQCSQESNEQNSKQLAFIRDYLYDKFETKDLILFCSDMLKKIHDKPA